MLTTRPSQGLSRSRQRRSGISLQVELLETRNLLNGAPVPGDAPDILDPLLSPELLQAGQKAEVTDSLFNYPDGLGDVDWYRFDLPAAAAVTLTIPPQTGSSLSAVLSLYNTTEPFDSIGQAGDRYETLGHRLLAQASASSGVGTQLVRELAAGSYYVAVSGEGNFHFHPFLAGSGYPGSTGDYVLQIAVSDLPSIPGPPAVLGVEPAADALLGAAPLVVRVRLSGPLSPGSQLQVRDGANQSVTAAWTNFSTLANEWQFAPRQALAPGNYSIVLINGAAETVVSSFQVAGVESNGGINAPADDYPSGAHELGNVLASGLIQQVGAIGDDPAYDPLDFGHPFLRNPSADVDLYHFEITTPGSYGLVAEVFAGRIGSPLDPGLSLFRQDPLGRLELITANDNTFNTTPTPGGDRLPLLNDALLFAGLTPGHYFLAVSSSGPLPLSNVPDPDHGLLPGPATGIFDPNQSHSGLNGTTLGSYVLNLVVYQDATAPTVVASDPAAGQVLTTSPTQLVVQFSEAVNLPLLANRAYFATLPFPPGLAAAYVVGTTGQVHYLGLQSYDPLSNRATFQLAGQLPDGDYELRLAGVADIAGNPLADGGEWVAPFTVAAGTPGPLFQPEQEPNDDPLSPQDLGPLVTQGVGVEGSLADPAGFGDFVDNFSVEVAQDGSYLFVLSPPAANLNLPAGITLLVLDAFGSPVPAASVFVGNGLAVTASVLPAGTYQVVVAFLDPQPAAPFNYQLLIVRTSLPENPPALTNGPAPALGLRLTTRVSPSLPYTPPRLTLTDLKPTVTPAVFSDGPFASLINTLSPGSLQSLSAGPLGGIGGPATSEPLVLANRLQLGNIETTLLAGLIRLTILTPATATDDDPGGFTGLANLVQDSLELMEKSWEQLLDGLFSGYPSLMSQVILPSEDVPEPVPPEEAIPLDDELIAYELLLEDMPEQDEWADWQLAEEEMVPAALVPEEEETPAWAWALAAVATAIWTCQQPGDERNKGIARWHRGINQ